MDGIYTNGLRLKVSGEQRDVSETVLPQFQAGDLIEGLITSVSERVSINFSGKEYSFPSESVRNAKEGEIRIYKIMEASGASFRLKEMRTGETAGGQAGVLFTTVTADPLAVADCLGKTENTEEAEEDEERLKDIANRITEEDLSGLEEEGMTIERFNLGRLERMLEQRKALRDLVRAGVEGQKEKLKVQRDFASKAARRTAESKLTSDARRAKIAERLEAVNLPVTESNVSRIVEAMNMAEEAQYMTEASFSYLIGERLTAQWPPTIENCYKAVHSGARRVSMLSEEVFQALQPQIAQVVEDAGLIGDGSYQTELSGSGSDSAGMNQDKVNQFILEHRQAGEADARWLLEHELPLTAENLQYKKELEQIRDCFRKGILNQDTLLDSITRTLYFRGDPKQTNLSQIIRREEIRLQMTEEIVGRIRDLGIEIDIDSIRERIEGLKEEEIKNGKKQLQEAGLEEKAGELLTQTMSAAETVRKAPASILAVTFHNRNFQTLQSLAQTAGTQAAWVGQMAESSYEALMTTPRSDMGDSIQKAFQNIDSQLEALQMDTSEENRRAVRILGYNHLPLTEENVLQMKYYDARVTGLIERLQPQVTVGLIRKGINPLTEPLDTVSRAAGEIAGELGPTPEERFSEFLVKLDRKQELSREERDSYIGIYRTLYQIQKTDGAAVGALVQSGRELNLKNLLTEARIRKSKGVDTVVDDRFGEAEEIHFREKTIDEQAEAAYQTRQVTKAIQELHQLTAGEPENEYRQKQLEEVRELAKDSLKELQFLEHYGIENNLNNLLAVKALLQNSNPYLQLAELAEKKRGSSTIDGGNSKDIKSTRVTKDGETKELLSLPFEAAMEAMESKESLNAYCETAATRVGELMEQLYIHADLTATEAAELKNIANSVELGRNLLSREYYEIPIRDEGGITGLRLTVIHENGEDGNFSLLMHGTEKQTVRMDGRIRTDRLELLVTTDHRRVYENFKTDRAAITERMKAIGLDCELLNYALTEHVPEQSLEYQYRSSEAAQNTDQKPRVSTRQLYQAAKEMVLITRRILL